MALRTLLIPLLLACVGCGEPHMDPEGRYVASEADFATFRDWPSVVVEVSDLMGGAHALGPATVYLRGEVPPDGAPFAVRTLIVKEQEGGETHAMAKTGGGYNPEGAFEWEWFDLDVSRAGDVSIIWRGEGSPADPGGYTEPTDGGVDVIGCNSCHVFALATDHVFTRPVFRDGI